MEHIVLPSSPEDIELSVPFVSIADYHSAFNSYLEDNHVSRSEILNPASTGRMLPNQAIAHLQTWLYFGTLRELTINPDDDGSFEKLRLMFTANLGNGESKIISTRNLCDFWSHIQAILSGLSSYEQELYRYRVESTMQSCSQFISNVDQTHLSTSHQAIVLSIILLTEFVMESANLRELESSRPYLRSLLVEAIMRRRGWCPSDIERLRLDLDVGTLLYTAHCRAPPTLREHTACSRMVCQARQILPTEDYAPRHASDGNCECEHISADLEIIFESLSKGVVPVCRYHDDHEPPTLELLESTNVSRYVAISHVWSDKLGNREANTLPRCLLNYIQARVDSAYQSPDEHVAFWIDTICCPVEPYSARLQAIGLMRETYADAERVLVLDQYLENLNSKGMTDFEQSLRVICTGWTRRLWTLQEGILAKKIYFQFCDGAIDGDVLFLHVAEPPIAYQTTSIFHAWMKIRLNWNGKLDSSVVGTAFVWMLYRALRFRTTSYITDEALCLSTLTGVDLKEITKVEPEERMRRFWELLPNISTALMYWDGPRLHVPGLRWAPASLLSASPESFVATHADQILKSKDVVRTEQGLVFCSSGMLLGKWRTGMRKGFWLKDQNNSWYYVDLTQNVGSPRSLSGESAVVGELTSWDRQSSPPQVLALLLDVPLDEAFGMSYVGVDARTNVACVLVSLFGANEEPNYLSAAFESAGVIRRIDPGKENSGGFSVPALAEVVEHELNSDLSVSAWPEVSSVRHMSQAERGLREFYGRMKPNMDADARFMDDPDIEAVIEDERLNLVISAEHVMFTGRIIPDSQCFCLG